MTARSLQAGAIFLSSSLVGLPARADGLRCGDRLVSTGDSTYEVRTACGAPDEAVSRVEYRTERIRVPGPCVRVGNTTRCDAVIERTITIVIDEWTYDFGRNRFIEFLRFENGRLVAVTEGFYGKKPN